MLTLEQIRERMRDRKVTVVADAIGVHANTVYRALNADGKPSYETVKLLSDYLLKSDQLLEQVRYKKEGMR